MKTLVWSSAVSLGFHSNKRTTPYAAEILGKFLGRYLKRHEVSFLTLYLSHTMNKKYRSLLKDYKSRRFVFLR